MIINYFKIKDQCPSPIISFDENNYSIFTKTAEQIFQKVSKKCNFISFGMTNPLGPYTEVIAHTLQASLCLRNFASEEVERHNKPEIEIQSSESSSVANAVMVTKSATEKILIETSINSVRLSLCVKQIDDVDKLIAKMFMRFLCQRADQFRILRRKPIEGYDISFLIMNVHTEQMVVSKLIQFIVTFIKDIDKELSDLKVTLNKRARNCGEEYLKALV